MMPNLNFSSPPSPFIWARAIMADSELMNSKWKRRMALIISGPAVCSIIIQLLSSRSNLSAPTSSAPAHRLMPVSALRFPPVAEYFWDIKERLTGNSGNLSRCLGKSENLEMAISFFAWIYRNVLSPAFDETQLLIHVGSQWSFIFFLLKLHYGRFPCKNTSRYVVSKQCKQISNTKYSHLWTTTTKAPTEAV